MISNAQPEAFDPLPDMAWAPFRINLGLEGKVNDQAIDDFIRRANLRRVPKPIRSIDETMSSFMTLGPYELATQSPRRLHAADSRVPVRTETLLSGPTRTYADLQNIAASRIQSYYLAWRLQKMSQSVTAVQRIFGHQPSK